MSSSVYEKVRELGKGSYGVVYEVKNKKNERFAMKINNTENCYLGTIYSLKEMDILSRGHPNHVIWMIESPYDRLLSKTEDRICMILEKGDMDGHTFLYKRCSIKERKLFFLYSLLAIEFLHSRGIVHGDVKPSNLIVFLNAEGTFRNAKITDFSISTFISNQRSRKNCIVTSYYRAPEICVKSYYNEKIDVWSTGIMGIELFMRGKHRLFNCDKDSQVLKALSTFLPFSPQLKEYTENIHQFKIEKKKSIDSIMKLRSTDVLDFNSSPGTYKEFIEVLNRSLETSVRDRASASELIEMPFFSKYRDIITKCRQETDINSEGVWILKPVPTIKSSSSENLKILLKFSKELLREKRSKYLNGATFLFLLMCINRYTRDYAGDFHRDQMLVVFNSLLIMSLKYVYNIDVDITTFFHSSEGFSCEISDVIKMERHILQEVFPVDIWEESYHTCMRRISPLSDRKLHLLIDEISSLKEGTYYINDILTRL